MIRGQLGRFVLVGVLNTAVYLGCYWLVHLVAPYLLAHVIAYAVSTIAAFFLHCRITYRTRPTWQKFLLFPLSNVAGFVATTATLLVLVDVLGVGERVAPVLAAVASVPVSFIVSRTILTGRREPADTA